MTPRDEARLLFAEVFGEPLEQRILDSGDPLCAYCQRRRVVADELCGRRVCRRMDEQRRGAM